MTNNEKYLLHCSGIYSFIAWVRDLQLSGAECIHNEDEIRINHIIARRFGIGFAKGKYTSNKPFLAIQANEHKWMKLIKWDKLCIRKNDPNLYFISKQMPGDQEIYPDIPSFILTIPLDHIEKIKLFEDIDRIEARELTFTEDGVMKINFSSKLFSINIKKLEEDDLLPKTEKGLFSRQDVILKKEARAMATEANYKFIGDESSSMNAWNDYQSKIDKIKKEWINKK